MPRLEGAATRGTAGIERVLGGLARRALGPGASNDWATTALALQTGLPA